jgi:cell division septation protein DedD
MRMLYKALIFVLFASGMVLAQFRTANLAGTVADEAGTPLGDAGIKVTFLTPSRDFVGPTIVREVWSGLTRENGDYKVPGLLLGSYQVETSLDGFDTNFRWVPLRTSADEMILDITLKAEGIPEAAPKQVLLPGPESREPIEEPVSVVTNGSQRMAPASRRTPPPVEPPPTSQPGFTSSRAVGLAIQIAAFQTRQNAEGLQAKLQDAGFTAYVVETDVLPGAARYYRVRVGPFDTREEARSVASNVRSRFPREIPDYWIVSY